MSDPTNQRADGCSIFFTLLSVVAISLLFVWIHGIFQPEQVEDVSENNRRIRMKKISNFTNENNAFVDKINAFHSESNSSLEDSMKMIVSGYQKPSSEKK